MFKYFSKIALRYLWNHKTYTGLNLVCLTFGFTCAVFAMLYIRNMFSYDRFQQNYNRLYSIESMVTYFNGDRFPKQLLSASLPDLLKKNVPEIDKCIRIAEREYTFINGDRVFNERGIYADTDFFSVFTFPLFSGQAASVLADPNGLVISETMAMKLFQNTDCIGKTIVLKDGKKQESFRVSGISRHVPSQSTIQFDFVIPFEKYLADNRWAIDNGASSNQTWVLLGNTATKEMVDAKIKKLIIAQEANLNQELFLFPLKDKLLYSYSGDKKVWRGMQTVVIVGAVGLLILLIACFNFINLAIAVNIRRYRESGIKKVVGSRKSIILYQFLGETFAIIVASLLLALFVVQALLGNFNAATHNEIQFRLTDGKTLFLLIGIALFTGLTAGLFPGIYLASSSPLSTLKGKVLTRHSFGAFRQGLIVFQFTIPIALIICMIIIRAQDSYMRNYDVGVDKDNLFILDNTENLQKHAAGVKADLLSIPGIEAISVTNCIPTRGTRVSNEVTWDGRESTEKLHFWCVNADFDYNKTVKVDIVEGRFFDPAFASDSNAFVINDIAAQVMNKRDPVGTSLTLEGKRGTIIGVCRGFHAVDLAGPYAPVIMSIRNEDRPVLLVKTKNADYISVMDRMKAATAKYDPETTFSCSLFRDLPSYTNLVLPSALLGVAFIIALLTACMGLFGLASFTSERRTKEIGIRKTNGATTFLIMELLLAKYIKWLLIAFAISLPIAFFLGSTFLARFHFHTSLPVLAFLAGPAIAIVVALSTVCSQTLHVARRNPVEALRYE